MTLKNELQLSNTREKLAGLQEQYELTSRNRKLNPMVRSQTLESIKKLINQLTEEIVRFESHSKPLPR
jgi:hypothetical protein